jgi:RNA polymerase sigma-B factor
VGSNLTATARGRPRLSVAWLRPALARLTDREQRIIRMRFVDGLTQEQIGDQRGVSQMQASRLLKVILGRLRDHLVIDHEAATD